MKDLLIGAVDNFGWNYINNWAVSIRKSGFTGDVILICYRIPPNEITTMVENCKKLDIETYQFENDNFDRPIQHNSRGRDTQSHQMRFYHAAQILKSRMDQYRWVIMTDVKDVIFQRNPSEWLNGEGFYNIIAPSEGIRYKHEPWGLQNIYNGYGKFVSSFLLNHPISNVGTIAAKAKEMLNICITLYSMGEGRYIPNDQSSWNVLVHGILASQTRLVPMGMGWACQCGTILDPTKKEQFKYYLLEPEPTIKYGLVYTVDDALFYLVHQYDRVPGLVEKINERYKEI